MVEESLRTLTVFLGSYAKWLSIWNCAFILLVVYLILFKENSQKYDIKTKF